MNTVIARSETTKQSHEEGFLSNEIATDLPRVCRTGLPAGLPQASPRNDKAKEGKILAFINPHYWVNPDDYAALNDRVSRLETEIKLLKSETIIGKK
ncbi:hypothetical protein HY772_09170 [Candidatus Woesearchaeota archaeon]|nr:hypothetical protein [Candidatus Woesearchaeota archaeon]